MAAIFKKLNISVFFPKAPKLSLSSLGKPQILLDGVGGGGFKLLKTPIGGMTFPVEAIFSN